MENKLKQNVALGKQDLKRLDKYKVSEFEPYWSVIKRILDEKEVKKK